MPYYRRWARRNYTRRKRYASRYNPLKGTVKRTFMPKTLMWKRRNQMDTRTMWFSAGGTIEGPIPGESFLNAIYRTYNLFRAGPQTWVADGLENMFNTYDQFQVKAIKVTWFPKNTMNEGAPGTIEPPDAPGAVSTIEPYLQRGDIASYVDQRYRPFIAAQFNINNLVNFASFKMHNANRKFTRIIYRPKANTRWGETDNYTDELQRQNDGWNAAIYMVQNGIFVNNPNADVPNQAELWYSIFTIKITFRGRKSDIRNL